MTEQQERTGPELPEHLARWAGDIRYALEQWSAVRESLLAVSGEGHDIVSIGMIYGALTKSLDRLLASSPEYCSTILDFMSNSNDVVTRYTAAGRVDTAYFADPSAAEGTISRLLTDPDPRVREEASDMLSFSATDVAAGNRDPDDDRGNIPVDYIRSLPVHNISAWTDEHGAHNVVIETGTARTNWHPLT